MHILAIDTSLEACAVGIERDERNAAAVILSETIGRGHAERLFGMISAALQEADLALAEIDRFAVTVGPGSFTGIRVGIAAVRGFSLATKKPAIGISDLAVHAESARAAAGGRPILATLAAKGGEVYAQLFDNAGNPLDAPEARPAERAARLAEEANAVLAGSGAEAVAAFLAGAAIAHRRSAPEMAALLRLARRAPAPTEPPRPLYLRAPDAVPAAARR